MKITILGSGSKGNSTLIEIENTKILIDVGFSYRTLKEKLNSIHVDPLTIDYILITHDHSDHIYGLKTYLKNYKPFIYMSKKIADVFFDFKYENLIYIEDELKINDITITTLETSHDATDSCGYLITYKDKSLVQITDTGYIHSKELNKIKNKTYYIFESNHDIDMLINGKYPPHLQHRILSDRGHLSNDLAGSYLSRIIGPNTKKVVLAHLSEENNTPKVALDTVKEKLKEQDIKIDLITASQYELTEVSND
jgi:phosphoribosyl 1,2-cyclic phosphodiesterase